jgi:hypothetical protein
MTIGTIAEPTAFAVVCVLAVLGLFAGWIFYRLAIPILLERMSA